MFGTVICGSSCWKLLQLAQINQHVGIPSWIPPTTAWHNTSNTPNYQCSCSEDLHSPERTHPKVVKVVYTGNSGMHTTFDDGGLSLWLRSRSHTGKTRTLLCLSMSHWVWWVSCAAHDTVSAWMTLHFYRNRTMKLWSMIRSSPCRTFAISFVSLARHNIPLMHNWCAHARDWSDSEIRVRGPQGRREISVKFQNEWQLWQSIFSFIR